MIFNDTNRYKYLCTCKSPKQVHYIYDSLGRPLYAYQCPECWRRMGDFIPHNYPDIKNAKPWLGGGKNTEIPPKNYRR